jgi:hypothetical protein
VQLYRKRTIEEFVPDDFSSQLFAVSYQLLSHCGICLSMKIRFASEHACVTASV